ncbi:MAG: YciI family protein [Marmoricola sp.]
MTRYLMTVHGPAEIDELGNYGSREEMEAAHAATSAFNEGLAEQGYWVFAGGLVSASQAAVVDGRADGPMVTDGPYLESKELLAGFWVIDVPDHATAVEIAAGASVACGCPVEIRAFDAYS